MRKLFAVLIFSTLFLTVSCSNEDDAKEKDEQSVEVSEEESQDENQSEKPTNNENDTSLEEFESMTVAEDLESMKSQTGGVLMDGITLDKELETDTDQFMEELDSELRQQLASITDQTKDSVEIEKALNYLLGSSNYKVAIENAESFQPDFEEPHLPEPQRVNGNGSEGGEVAGKAIILLDASSSMLLSVDGEVKMDIAKDAVKRFADVIGEDSDVSLVVYGHKGSESNADKELSCEGIEEIYPMGKYDSDAFENSLGTFESKGWTPLAGAINKATEMSGDLKGSITVYIVSDGVETCDGDPVKAAENFVQENENRTVNIIGFNVDQQAEEQLIAVSEAGNGAYYSANNAEEIQETIEYEWLPSLTELAWAHTKAPGPWEIIAQRDRYKAEHAKINSIIEKERDRYDWAMDIIYEEELIPSEVSSEVSDNIKERYSSKMDSIKELQSNKINEIDSIADEIKERVRVWTEEMKDIVYD